MRIKYLDWDSDFFRQKTGAIHHQKKSKVNNHQLKELLNTSKKEGYEVIYFFSESTLPLQEKLCRQFRGKLVDTKILYSKSLLEQEAKKHLVEGICTYQHSVASSLLQDLAIQSGAHSRFHIDPHFSTLDFERLYKQWILNSIKGTFADKVFIYLKDQQEKALLTIKRISHVEARIGLLAVDTSLRGKKIGTSLLHAAENFCMSLGIETLSVYTQKDNHIACSFYEKFGFKELQCQYVYHFWLQKINHENPI